MRVCSKCGLAAVPLLRGMCGGCYNAAYQAANPKKKRPRVGRRGSKWAFTAEQVRRLRAEYRARLESGEATGYISRRAAQLGVAHTTLSNAVQGISYRWVE